MVFGDNESVINSAAIPHSKMHKRWVALSYHRVRWAVAAGIINIYHIAGKKNPADILSKHWDLPSVWNTMKPILFRYPGIDSELDEEELKKISKEADAEKLVLTEDTISKLKATQVKQKGSSDSRPHRGE